MVVDTAVALGNVLRVAVHLLILLIEQRRNGWLFDEWTDDRFLFQQIENVIALEENR